MVSLPLYSPSWPPGKLAPPFVLSSICVFAKLALCITVVLPLSPPGKLASPSVLT